MAVAMFLLSKSVVLVRTACVTFPEIGGISMKAAFRNRSMLFPAAAIAANPARMSSVGLDRNLHGPSHVFLTSELV
jgi:hypothetical protein